MSVIAAPSGRSHGSAWVAFALLIAGTLGAYQIAGLNQALLFLIGGALGMTLYHASFGFTSSWRVFIKERRGRGLRAQMLMLALAVLLFFPALGAGELFGSPVEGFVSPVSLSVMIGAFIFGIGMQLGGERIRHAVYNWRGQCAHDCDFSLFLRRLFIGHGAFGLVVQPAAFGADFRSAKPWRYACPAAEFHALCADCRRNGIF